MKPQNVKLSVLAIGLFLASSGVALAQRPAHYYPMRDPISPYLFYSAINTTGLPNYYAFVRPSMQFRSYTSRTDPQIQRVEERIALTGDRVERLYERQLEMRGTTGVGAPAAPATYMDYSHFYQQTQRGARRR